MKRQVNVCLFGGDRDTATIVIDKNGMRVEDKQPFRDDDFFIRNYISDCLNMDEWKHTWHLDVSKAKYKKSDERKAIRKILLNKINARKSEIQEIKDAIQILGRW